VKESGMKRDGLGGFFGKHIKVLEEERKIV
jgi:hypothetical protein